MSVPTKNLVSKFIKLDQLIKKKEGEVEELKIERGLVEAELLPRFEQAGIAAMRSTSKVTVYIRRDLFASAVDKNTAGLCEAIKSIPAIRELVKEGVNAQTFSAYVREQAKQAYGEEYEGKSVEEIVKALPEVLQSVTHLTEKFSLRTRKG